MLRICSLILSIILLPGVIYGSGKPDVAASFQHKHSYAAAKMLKRCSPTITISANEHTLFSEYRSEQRPKKRIELSALSNEARKFLYEGLYTLSSNAAKYDPHAGVYAFHQIAGKNPLLMQGIEFITSEQEGIKIIYALPIGDKLITIDAILKSDRFLDEYRKALFIMSKKAFFEKTYADSLRYIELLETYRKLEVEESLFAAMVYLQAGQPEKAEQIVTLVFAQLDKLSAVNAEKLGDLFFELGNESSAVKAYEEAIAKIN